MPPAKKRRVAAAKAAAEFVDGDAAIIEMKADDAFAVVPPPPQPNSVVVVPDHDYHQHQNGILTAKLFDMHRTTIKILRDNIAKLTSMAASSTATTTTNRSKNGTLNDHTDTDKLLYEELLLSSSLAISDLKSIQRRLSLQVEQHATISKERRERVEQYSLLLENLMYERKYLQQEVMTLTSWKPKELEKMAWSELGMNADGGGLGKGGSSIGSSSTSGERKGMEVDTVSPEKSTKITTAKEAIDAYLFGNTTSEAAESPPSHRDPSQQQFILQKIQSDLEVRASLVEELSKSKLELKELQKKRDNLRGFLNQIPKKLLELEKAGESLNTFFGSNHDVWKDVLASNEDDDDDGDTDEAMMDVEVSHNDTRKYNEKKQVQAANLLVHRASCDRTKRFQMAQSNLPSPLYVLFVQLTGYIDAWSTLDKLGGFKSRNHILDGFVGANGMNVTVVFDENGGGGGNGRGGVVLTLSPADILPSEVSSILGKSFPSHRSGSSGGVIKIIFVFNADQGVVLALVEGDGEMNSELLDNLFPGDDGMSNPNVSLSLLSEERSDEGRDAYISTEGENHDGKESEDSNAGKFGKPYYWCQVLSGLNFPPPLSAANNITGMTNSGEEEEDASFQIQSCTKAVFRQLIRRVRARKTLAAILEYLGKRSSLHPLPIPIHPTLKTEGSKASQSQATKAKLHSWTEDLKDGNPGVAGTTQKSYIAIIKRKSSLLKASVLIDTQNYPAEPPLWSLQNEDGSMGLSSSWAEDYGSVSSLQPCSDSSTKPSPPLFDAALNSIEYHVNQDLDKFVDLNVEATFDWILIHQLADIISCWDEVMVSNEGNVGGSQNVSKGGAEFGTMAGQMRMRKGKDRRLIGFGERSPFFRIGL